MEQSIEYFNGNKKVKKIQDCTHAVITEELTPEQALEKYGVLLYGTKGEFDQSQPLKQINNGKLQGI